MINKEIFLLLPSVDLIV
uniref:Uncharacterized protein n=1 Tax=Arundo donax TaxID=35708 RepID=A0A0A8YV61_ARUDO